MVNSQKTTQSGSTASAEPGVLTGWREEIRSFFEQTVQEMVEGALRNSQANRALSISGIAGPDGGTLDKPVGTVWFAWAGQHRENVTLRKKFDGERDAVRRQAVVTALKGLIEYG